MNIQCIKCKGRGFCGRKFCAIATKIRSQKQLNRSAKQDFFGEAPNVFIGQYGYPNLNVGILSTEHYEDHDAPLRWSASNAQIQQVIDLRTNLINSAFKANVRSHSDRFLELSREVSLASRPVDMELNLDRKPYFHLQFNQDNMPHGPRVNLKKAQITENPKIPNKIDRAVSDTDLKAADALSTLRKDFDEHYLTKVFSVGNLGIKTDRRLVPTRWSITAVDDIIGKDIIEKIKQHKHTDYLAYFGGYLGNYYLILMFPNCWSYELFETLVGEQNSFATDHEFYDGRKSYAESTAGGYYAARLAILEKLEKIKRQSSILAFRFITDEYWAPLGVWVVREATRKSMSSQPIEFSSKELLLKYAKALAKKKFNFDLDTLLRDSRLLDNLDRQRRIGEF